MLILKYALQIIRNVNTDKNLFLDLGVIGISETYKPKCAPVPNDSICQCFYQFICFKALKIRRHFRIVF